MSYRKCATSITQQQDGLVMYPITFNPLTNVERLHLQYHHIVTKKMITSMIIYAYDNVIDYT